MPVVVVPATSRRPWRVAVLVTGLGLVATGVALTIHAELGVAPYDVLSTGMRDLFGIPIAVAAVVLPLSFAALGVLLGGRVGIGTVLAVVLVGPVLGLVLDRLPPVEAMAPRVVLFGVGFVVITLGIAFVIVPEIGPAPPELLMLALRDRGLELATARTGIEVASVAVGWAMGGQVGVGTVVFAVLVGPALRWTLEAVGYDTTRAVEASDAAAPGA